MKPLFLKNACLILLMALVASCNKETDPVEPPRSLTAVATASPTEVEVGETVNLSSTSSVVVGNIDYGVVWEISSKPTGSNATINNTSAATTSFVPDVAGDYEVTLTISNSTFNLNSTDQVAVEATQTVSVVLSSNIVNDLVLENINPNPDEHDYVVTEFLTIAANLTILPGVTILFEEGAGFQVNNTGRIKADGTEAEKIIFTGTEPQPGFWAGIRLHESNNANSIKNAEIHYAGSRQHHSFFGKAAISPEYSSITLENLSITNSGQYGIQTRDNETVIEMNNINFENNIGSSMYILAEQTKYIDEASNFNDSYVEIYYGDIISTGNAAAWVNLKNGKYLISNDLRIARTLNIAPGAVIEAGTNVLITVMDIQNAAIVAKGTAENPILFSGKTKSSGAWKGILVSSSSDMNQLEYVTIEYGGSNPQLSTLIGPANLGISDAAKLKINNCHITNSAGYGIIISSIANTSLTNSTITYENNASGDIKTD